MPLTAYAGILLPSLDFENPDDPISLEICDLKIKVRGADRDGYLAEIGSGSNWLFYHLAMLLALHQFDISQPNSPVPGFLVLDQPSQVYFPKNAMRRPDEEEQELRLRDEDLDAVRKAYEVLGKVVLQAKGKLQVIVLDLASRDLWGNIHGMVGLNKWRDEIKLVPMKWLQGDDD